MTIPYSRSKILYGDGQTHGSYEFSLNADGTDYDWDHAANTETQASWSLFLQRMEMKRQKLLLRHFQEDNNCYTIEDVEGNTVTDPQGILYMTANSASGSKYYELISTQQDYIAAHAARTGFQAILSLLWMLKFSVDTYQITDDGSVEAIDDTFTIEKNCEIRNE